MRKRVVIFVLCGLCLTMVSLLGARHWIFRDATDQPPPAVDSSPPRPDRSGSPGVDLGAGAESASLNIISMRGPVERRVKDEPWAAAEVGDVLGEAHSLRTSGEGSAVLSAGDRSQLTIAPKTEVSVREINEQIHTLRLQRGRLSVDYQKDGRRLIRVESDTGAAAEATEGKFTVMRTRTAMAVATETATVDLHAAGRTVQIKAGEQSVVLDDQPPSGPMAIPRSVLLRIAGLSGAPIEIRGDSALLKGSTQAGNRVTIRKQQVQVDGRGQFTHRVNLRPGLNRIHIEIEDPAGHQRTRVVEYFALPREGLIEDIKLRWTKKK